MTDDVRRQCLDHGWFVLPLKGKACVIKGWSRPTLDASSFLAEHSPKLIYPNTGVRLGLQPDGPTVVAVDLDIDDADLGDEVEAAMAAAVGARWDDGLWRDRGNRAAGLFRLTSGKITRRRTGRYTPTEAADAASVAAVEILGQGCLLAAYGDHPKGGTWEWRHGLGPHSVRPDALPGVTAATLSAALAAAEAVMGQRWERVTAPSDGRLEVKRDLEPELEFDIDGALMTAAEIEDSLGPDEALRGNLTGFRPDSDSNSGVFRLGPDGRLAVEDYAAGVRHVWSPEALRAEAEGDIERLRSIAPKPIVGADRSVTSGCGGSDDLVSAWANLPRLTPGMLPVPSMTAGGGYRTSQPVLYENVRAILQAAGITARFDMVMCEVAFQYPPSVAAMAQQSIEYQLGHIEGLGVSAGMTSGDAIAREIERISLENKFNRHEEWFLSLPEWDGGDHITAAADTVVAEFQISWRMMFKRWLIQAVQAAMGWRRPDVLRLVLTLVGDQGIHKSRWCEALVPPGMFVPGFSLNEWNTKDDILKMRHGLIVELAELDGSYRKATQEHIKALIASPEDVIRRPYGRKTERLPRTSVFCATANSRTILRDPTGSTRFLANQVVRCEVEELKQLIDLEQLWAQALALWRDGERWWLGPEEVKQQAMAAHELREPDAIVQMFTEIYEPGGERTMSVSQVLLEMFPGQKPQQNDTRKLTEFFRREFGPGRRVKGYRVWNLKRRSLTG